MKERPILMHTRSINGILEGRKSQTRRIIKNVPNYDHCGKNIMEWALSGIYQDDSGQWWLDIQTDVDDNSHEELRCPYGQTGDRLWVREQFSALESFDFFNPDTPDEVPEYWYWADGNPKFGDWTRPKPSIHMPRIACRIILEVTGIRVERVQEINIHDGQAEGLNVGPLSASGVKNEFRELWDDTNGKGAWERNDWCWVVGFKRICE